MTSFHTTNGAIKTVYLSQRRKTFTRVSIPQMVRLRQGYDGGGWIGYDFWFPYHKWCD